MKTALMTLATLILTSTQVFAAITCALSKEGKDGEFTKIIWQGEVSPTDVVKKNFSLFVLKDNTILSFDGLSKMMKNIRSIEDSKAFDRILATAIYFGVGPVESANTSIAEHMALTIGKVRPSDAKQQASISFVKPSPFNSIVDSDRGIAVACSTESLEPYLVK